MRRTVLFVTILVLAMISLASASSINILPTSGKCLNYTVPSTLFINGTVHFRLKGLPYVISRPVNESVLEKSSTLITLKPIYKIAGAGYAIFDEHDDLVMTPSTSARSPIAYCPTTDMFAAMGPITVFDLKTGEKTDIYPSGVYLFKVVNGKPVVLAKTSVSNIAFIEASVALSPTTLVVQPNYQTLIFYHIIYYTNGSVNLVKVRTLNATEFAKEYASLVGLNVSKASYFDNMFVTPSNNILLTGRWTNFTGDIYVGYQPPLGNITITPNNILDYNYAHDIGGDVALLTWDGQLISGVPITKTEIYDADIYSPLQEGFAIFSNEYSNNAYFSTSGTSVLGTPMLSKSPVGVTWTWPEYLAAAPSQDGKYVFAYKSISNEYGTGNANVRVVLEVWSSSGQLIEVVNNSSAIDYLPGGVGVTQPRSPTSLSNMGAVQIIPFPDGMVIYNTKVGKYKIIGFNRETTGRLAAASADGHYVVLGNTVYEVDFVLNIPSIVYEGSANVYFDANYVPLNKSVVVRPPTEISKDGAFMVFKGGKIFIGAIFSKKRVENIVTNEFAKKGLLWNMYEQGLIHTFISTNVKSGEITNQHISEGGINGEPNPHAIMYTRDIILKPWAPYIAVGSVGSAIDIRVPLSANMPAKSFSKVNLHYSLSYATLVPEYYVNKIVGLMVQEFGVGIGTSLAGGIAYKLLPKVVPDELTASGTVEDAVATSWATSAGTALSVGASVAGIAMVVDGTFGYYSSINVYHDTMMHTMLIVAPVFYNPYTREKYTIVHLILPSCANVAKWKGYVEQMLKNAGINNYIIQVTIMGDTWQSYQDMFAHTSKSTLQKIINLQGAIPLLAEKYGVRVSDLRIKEVHLYIDTITEGRVSLWQWATGGLKFGAYTMVVCQSGFTGQAVVPAQTITNPQDICNVLNPIYVNGIPVNLTPAANAAVASFMLPAKTKFVAISTNKPYYATLNLSLEGDLIAPLYNDKPGLYETNFTYPWKYCFNESRIYFAGMPKPMYSAYEIVYTTHGMEPVNMTPYMSFITKIPDNTSPTHVRYYYGTITRHDLMLIDPHNAGLMEPQKRYWIQYWYEPPRLVMGDTSIHVMFNGTTIASTLPRHARVIINSSRPQTVYGYLQVIVGYEDQNNHKFYTVDTHTFDFALRVGANGSTYKEWDIQKYVGEAIHQYALGKVGYVKLVGKITKAAYDCIKTNDEDSLIYYPPPSLTKVKPVVVTIDVLNSLTHAPIAGAKVVFDNSTYTTNAEGLVNITTTSGYHSLVVSATGYHTKKTGVLAYTNMTYYVYLIPSSDYIIMPPNGTNPNPWWIGPNNTSGYGVPPGAPNLPFGKNNTTGWTNTPIIYNSTNKTYLLPVEVVVQYFDGMPVQGATVEYMNATTGALVSTLKTDGSGYAVAYVPAYYNLTVNVTDPALNYTAQETILVDHPLILPFTVSETSSYYSPEVAVNNVSIWIHMGMGDIPSGTTMAPVYHSVDCWFYTNTPQNITFEIWLVNTKTNETVASESYTVHLHKGFQKVREFIPVKLNNFTTCQVFCKITRYEYDTNPYNNMAVGNVVTFRPWIDIYPTVLWYPVKQKVSDALLPGDIVKVCVGVHVPKGVTVPNIHVDYKICQHNIVKNKMVPVTSQVKDLTSLGQVSTVWYNYTIQLPWTDKVTVSASVNNSYDLSPSNNNASATITLSPDSQCLSAKPQVFVASANSIVPVRVVIRSNYINTIATVSVIDETDHNTTLAVKSVNITAPITSTIVSVRVPKTSNKLMQSHVWMVTVFVPGDVYPKDSYKEFTVTISGLPSWVILGAVFLFVLIVLVLVRHLLTIRPPRQGRYFKRVDGEGRDSFGAAKIGYKRGKGRYFQKFK